MNVYKRKIFKLIDLVRVGGRPGRHQEALLKILRKNAEAKDYTFLNNPLQALEESRGKPFITNVPLFRCRGFGLLAFPMTKNSSHPFIQTLNEYKKTGLRRYKGSPLEGYYLSYHPMNGGDVWGIDPFHDKKLAKHNVLNFVEPWLGIPSKREMTNKLYINKIEAMEHGDAPCHSLEWQHYGPASNAKGMFEYERLINTYESIKIHGYIRKKGSKNNDIKGTLLIDCDKYVAIIRSGQHRAAALVANGYTTVPICFDTDKWLPVIRSNACDWPAVKYNFLLEKEAKQIFDRIMDGNQPFPATISKFWMCDE